MKVTLRNTQTGKLESFEPIDAKEVLAGFEGEPSIYEEVPDRPVGENFDVGAEKFNVPQLQGGDAELQTGLSTDKYARQQVVIAEPGAPLGKKEDANSAGALGKTTDAKSDKQDEGDDGDTTDKRTVAELKQVLDDKGVDYPANAKKADLQALVAVEEAK